MYTLITDTHMSVFDYATVLTRTYYLRKFEKHLWFALPCTNCHKEYKLLVHSS